MKFQLPHTVTTKTALAMINTSGIRIAVQSGKEQMMSRWIDAEWLMNFFVDIPDNFTLTIGNLRATVNDAPTIKTKQIKYYDEDEQVWKIGEVIEP